MEQRTNHAAGRTGGRPGKATGWRARLWLGAFAVVAAAGPAGAETGSQAMDRTIASALEPLFEQADSPDPASGRARFMACGYVAPALAREPAPAEGGDAAFGRMLEWLRGQLRRMAE